MRRFARLTLPAFVSLLWWPAASGAKAEKPAADDRFSIASIAPAMTLDDARTALKAAGYSFTTRLFTHPVDPEAEHPEVIFASRTELPNILSDELIIWLTHPPAPPAVLAIYRDVAFGQDHMPRLTDYLDAAKTRAGFEIYRRLPGTDGDPYNAEQLIRWRPSGKSVGGLDKLLVTLPSSTPIVDPCIENFLFWDRNFRPIRDQRTYADAMWRKGYYDSTGIGFASFASCGTTYQAYLRRDAGGFVLRARLLLVDQAAAVRDAATFRQWMIEQNAAYRAKRDAAAAKPEI